MFVFDKAVFEPLWRRVSSELPQRRAIPLFNRHVKHHISDHRPGVGATGRYLTGVGGPRNALDLKL